MDFVPYLKGEIMEFVDCSVKPVRQTRAPKPERQSLL
jgi:hypothetical protein